MALKNLKIKFLNLPFVGNKEKIPKEQKQLKMMGVSIQINEKVFRYFREHREIHRVDKLLSLSNLLSLEEAELFDVDVRKIDLKHHSKQMFYGTGRFYNRLDLLPPDGPLQQILLLNSIKMNHDFMFAMKGTKRFNTLNLASFADSVLNGQKF